MGRAALLPFMSRADPGGAECIIILSSARMVLVLPVPGGPWDGTRNKNLDTRDYPCLQTRILDTRTKLLQHHTAH